MGGGEEEREREDRFLCSFRRATSRALLTRDYATAAGERGGGGGAGAAVGTCCTTALSSLLAPAG